MREVGVPNMQVPPSQQIVMQSTAVWHGMAFQSVSQPQSVVSVGQTIEGMVADSKLYW